MSLDKLPRDPIHANAHHNHQDLLSADDDLLGGGDLTQTPNLAHGHAHAHSASPAKINFAKFKKGANSQTIQPQESPATTQWNVDLTGGQAQNNNQNGGNNILFNLQSANSQSQGQQQQQAQPQIDLKQLYNQGGHQNHFMQGQSRQNWNFQGMNPQGFSGGYNVGGMGMQQNNGQFNQTYGAQPMGGYQQPINYNGNMGGVPQMGYNQGFAQPQNQYQNNGFVQVQNANKFF